MYARNTHCQGQASFRHAAKAAGFCLHSVREAGFWQQRPRWLFAPYWVDAHPDHQAATKLIEAARFWAKLTKCELAGEPFHPERIFYYSCVHLRVVRAPAFVVDITDTWDRKWAAASPETVPGS